MKTSLAILTLAGFLFIEAPAITQAKDNGTRHSNDLELKLNVFDILDTKCNICHRKKNPFMVFSLKNMEKRAPKIYKQVLVKKRMPKGNEIYLTHEEYSTLKKWLLNLNIY